MPSEIPDMNRLDNQTPVLRPKRLFVVASRRSGTTWAMRLLAQHPDVVACQQSGLFSALQPLSEFWHWERRYGRWIHAPASTAVSDDGNGSRAGLSLHAVLDRARYAEFVRPIVEYVFDRIASTHPSPKAIVEQTPENLRIAHAILQILPDAYFLHVIRDPRSVFASQRQAALTWARPGDFSLDPTHAAKEWRSDVMAGRDIAVYTSHYLETTYEKLRKDGAAELQRIFAWLGLSAELDLCARAVESCAIDKLRDEPSAPKGFYRKGETQGWRAELNRRQVKQIEYVAGDMMAVLGYERLFPNLRRKTPLRFQLRKLIAGLVQERQAAPRPPSPRT